MSDWERTAINLDDTFGEQAPASEIHPDRAEQKWIHHGPTGQLFMWDRTDHPSGAPGADEYYHAKKMRAMGLDPYDLDDPHTHAGYVEMNGNPYSARPNKEPYIWDAYGHDVIPDDVYQKVLNMANARIADPTLKTSTHDKTSAQQVMYHLAPRDARESIQQNGIDWNRATNPLPNDDGPDGQEEWPRANYLFHEYPDMKSAWDDVYEVNAEGLTLHPDPYHPEGDYASYTHETIPPHRIRLLPAEHTSAATNVMYDPDPPDRLRLLTDERTAGAAGDMPEHTFDIQPATGSLQGMSVMRVVHPDGYSMGHVWFHTDEEKPGWAKIHNLTTSPSFRRKGVATHLVNELQRRYPQMEHSTEFTGDGKGLYENLHPGTEWEEQPGGHTWKRSSTTAKVAAYQDDQGEWQFDDEVAPPPTGEWSPARERYPQWHLDVPSRPGGIGPPPGTYNWLDRAKPGEIHNQGGDCINPKCQHQWSDEEAHELAQYGEITCPACHTEQNSLGQLGKAPDQEQYDAAMRNKNPVRAGVTLTQMGQIGEQIIQRVGQLPCGPIIRDMNKEDSTGKSPVDFVAGYPGKEWGVEVKANHSEAQPRFKVSGSAAKRQRMIEFCHANGLRQGFCGVRLNFYTDKADVFWREGFTDTWYGDTNMSHVGTYDFGDLNPFRQPDGSHHVPAQDQMPDQASEDDQGAMARVASGADHDGAMVALFVPAEAADKLHVEGGEPKKDMHITVAFFKVKAADESDEYWAGVKDVVEAVAREYAPLEVTVGGLGRFNGGDDDDFQPLIGTIDCMGLAELHVALKEKLGDEFPLNDEHGFNPHVTIQYIDRDRDDPNLDLPVDFTVSELTLMVGGKRTDYPLTGEDHTSVLSTTQPGSYEPLAARTARLAPMEILSPAEYREAARARTAGWKDKYNFHKVRVPQAHHHCGGCGAFNKGHCAMFDAPVDNDDTCDEWVTEREWEKEQGKGVADKAISKEAKETAPQTKRRMESIDQKYGPFQGIPIWQHESGHSVYQLPTREEVKREGERMRNCWQGGSGVLHGYPEKERYLSMRDPEGRSVADWYEPESENGRKIQEVFAIRNNHLNVGEPAHRALEAYAQAHNLPFSKTIFHGGLDAPEFKYGPGDTFRHRERGDERIIGASYYPNGRALWNNNEPRYEAWDFDPDHRQFSSINFQHPESPWEHVGSQPLPHDLVLGAMDNEWETPVQAPIRGTVGEPRAASLDLDDAFGENSHPNWYKWWVTPEGEANVWPTYADEEGGAAWGSPHHHEMLDQMFPGERNKLRWHSPGWSFGYSIHDPASNTHSHHHGLFQSGDPTPEQIAAVEAEIQGRHPGSSENLESDVHFPEEPLGENFTLPGAGRDRYYGRTAGLDLDDTFGVKSKPTTYKWMVNPEGNLHFWPTMFEGTDEEADEYDPQSRMYGVWTGPHHTDKLREIHPDTADDIRFGDDSPWSFGQALHFPNDNTYRLDSAMASDNIQAPHAELVRQHLQTLHPGATDVAAVTWGDPNTAPPWEQKTADFDEAQHPRNPSGEFTVKEDQHRVKVYDTKGKHKHTVERCRHCGTLFGRPAKHQGRLECPTCGEDVDRRLRRVQHVANDPLQNTGAEYGWNFAGYSGNQHRMFDWTDPKTGIQHRTIQGGKHSDPVDTRRWTLKNMRQCMNGQCNHVMTPPSTELTAEPGAPVLKAGSKVQYGGKDFWVMDVDGGLAHIYDEHGQEDIVPQQQLRAAGWKLADLDVDDAYGTYPGARHFKYLYPDLVGAHYRRKPGMPTDRHVWEVPSPDGHPYHSEKLGELGFESWQDNPGYLRGIAMWHPQKGLITPGIVPEERADIEPWIKSQMGLTWGQSVS